MKTPIKTPLIIQKCYYKYTNNVTKASQKRIKNVTNTF